MGIVEDLAINLITSLVASFVIWLALKATQGIRSRIRLRRPPRRVLLVILVGDPSARAASPSTPAAPGRSGTRPVSRLRTGITS
ncbi:hypothetical protein ACI2LC_16385 [Nonomuraea wenchangensis]|uniref:hypothetical protein n=1 Tax=Nonomuraea wenchangensis TaxID=568860 RepID=UPI00384CB360